MPDRFAPQGDIFVLVLVVVLIVIVVRWVARR